jgi:hypothetical protein
MANPYGDGTALKKQQIEAVEAEAAFMLLHYSDPIRVQLTCHSRPTADSSAPRRGAVAEDRGAVGQLPPVHQRRDDARENILQAQLQTPLNGSSASARQRAPIGRHMTALSQASRDAVIWENFLHLSQHGRETSSLWQFLNLLLPLHNISVKICLPFTSSLKRLTLHFLQYFFRNLTQSSYISALRFEYCSI